ncbi:MAG: FAD-binding oxidoreductase [Acidimicrobiales bacterium]
MTGTGRRSDRRSLWAWCLESEEPTEADRAVLARELSARAGVPIVPRPPPAISSADLRPSRISVPKILAEWCTTDPWSRAFHTYGSHMTDRLRAFNKDFETPPDVVAEPRSEAELESTLDWCVSRGYVIVPFGGGSSVVWGVNTPEAEAVVTIATGALDQVLEVDGRSLAARIQAGVLGPHLEDQLRPLGYTLRHFPQSFRFSSLGGWIATRASGHYATNRTHIDDFLESVRMLTPMGWWESRRLPGSGAGPSPDRLVLGSEGTLGIITEAWMRVQRRPLFRASVAVTFDSWVAGCEGVRRIVQAHLWPSNLRLLDPSEAGRAAGMDGTKVVMLLGFESPEVPQANQMACAVEIARDAGGQVDDAEVKISDGTGEPTGRSGATGTWRESFIGVGSGIGTGVETGLGLVADTFESAVTWDRWPEFDLLVRERVGEALRSVFGHAPLLSCRITHVYPDGPAPYYTWAGMGRPGSEQTMWSEVKQAASQAVLDGGGTITHHHGVGRMHRQAYDRERPRLFGEILRAGKAIVDPSGLLNPGVLIDP